MTELFDNIQNLKYKSLELIRNLTDEDPLKYLSKSIRSLINDQDKEMLSHKTNFNKICKKWNNKSYKIG